MTDCLETRLREIEEQRKRLDEMESVPLDPWESPIRMFDLRRKLALDIPFLVAEVRRLMVENEEFIRVIVNTRNLAADNAAEWKAEIVKLRQWQLQAAIELGKWWKRQTGDYSDREMISPIVQQLLTEAKAGE